MKALRAWDVKYREMIYINDLYWFEENGVHDFEDEDYIFMWSIGVNDINGKVMYGGDILPYRNVVTYVDSSEGSNLGMNVGWYGQRDNFESWSEIEVGQDYEVLGNIYENPLLLVRH